MNALLSVRGLGVDFETGDGPVHVLENVSLDIAPGEITGIIGESGSGKSVMAFAVMGILDPAARITGGDILFRGESLLAMDPRRRDGWRGREAAIIFQNPRAALNPIRRVGDQIGDVIARHDRPPAHALRGRVEDALRRVGIPDPARRARAWPFELSGGQCQRISIAMALACRPGLLIADEPTTGLDVTTQAAIIALIRALARENGTAVALITHDLALAAATCDRLAIMHAGHVVETAPAPTILAAPRHPYTRALLASAPALAGSINELQPIPGRLPDLRRADLPPCRFAERCPRRIARCDAPGPLGLHEAAPRHLLACRNPP
ncbi:MAG: ABC transporter ATP-binding protein [Rubellimicrobium sp.]|nr:ABC transporter ATP-binding protein [Rubellimicrobium sp.]